MIKIFSQLLGRYSSNKKPLILFRLDESLLYRLSDIQPLFGLNGIDYSQFEGCYRDSEDIYLNTGVLHSYAVEKSCQRLAELSKLKADDFQAGLADEILDTFPEFKRTPKEDQVWEAVQLPFERLSAPLVKSEPLSPPTLKSTDNRNPMALDKVLLNTNESSSADSERVTKRPKLNEKRPQSSSAISTIAPRPTRTIQSYPSIELEQASPSKKYAPKPKNTLNLTIIAPSYHEQLSGIRSAPLHSNHPPPPAQGYHKSNLAISSTHSSLKPTTAGLQPSSKRHEFAIPPIVPSQQQPPHSAHLPRESHGYPYATSPYGYPFPRHPSRPESQIATTAASVPLPPKTPTTTSFAALQRQQYLQPFEHLFDTMETTRTLKATLDDQIRRSSSLMQTLQASATTLEGLIRNQIKEAQWEMMAQAEQKLEALIKRVDTLEGHASPTREDKAAAEDLVALSEKSYELQKPPTIVRSQNDIGPQEYYNMLNTLRDRLDRLERQIEA